LLAFLSQRLLQIIPTLILVSMLIFGLQQLLPGDPALIMAGEERDPKVLEEIREQYRLNEPIPVQYFYWIKGVLSGNLGESMRLKSSVSSLVAEKLPANDPQKKVVVDYKTTYEKNTGQPVSTFGGHAYDGLMILVDAMKRAKSADKAKVRDAIEATKGFMGTAGVVNMSPTDHLGLDLSAFRMLEIKNGDWTLVN